MGKYHSPERKAQNLEYLADDKNMHDNTDIDLKELGVRKYV